MKLAVRPLSIAVLGGLLTIAGPAMADTIKLRIIETTDIHTNVMDYDYYKDKPSQKIGLTRAATLVKQAQQEVTNSVLVDNGDLIQGSPMGDYMAAKGIEKGEVHPVYKAMNQLNYDVGNIGNHEFNYGLDFLMETIDDANFPYISANVFDKKTGEHYFTPYIIKTHNFKDVDGNVQEVKVGYIGCQCPFVAVRVAYLRHTVTPEGVHRLNHRFTPRVNCHSVRLIHIVHIEVEVHGAGGLRRYRGLCRIAVGPFRPDYDDHIVPLHLGMNDPSLLIGQFIDLLKTEGV